MASELMSEKPEKQGKWELQGEKRGFQIGIQEAEKNLEEGKMVNQKKNRRAPNEVENAPGYTAQLEKILRQPNYAAFIEEIQQKLRSDPQYLRSHRDEAFRQTLTVLERSGELKNIQPSEHDVETALMAIVGMKNR
jgi:hypothetical protein